MIDEAANEAYLAGRWDRGRRFGAAVIWEEARLLDGRVQLRITPDQGEELTLCISRTGRSLRVFRGGVELVAKREERDGDE